MAEDGVELETMRLLMDGKLSKDELEALIRQEPKDPQRFFAYLQVLQERVPWDDSILLRIADHLYIVRRKSDGELVVKCHCGCDFGDYRVNWKLGCLIRVRATLDEFAEIYQPREFAPDPDYVEMREFFCPDCLTQLGVEVALHGDPVLFEFLPDVDTFYREWLEQPLEDDGRHEYRNLTEEAVKAWA